MKRALVWISGVVFALALLIAGVFAFPHALFAHSYMGAGLTLHTVAPVDDAAAKRFLIGVRARLNASVMGPVERPMSVFMANGGWRERLFFAVVPQAGAVVYPALSDDHAFVRRGDVGRNRLFKGEFELTPPRDLTYFAVHELGHLATVDRVGRVRFHLCPAWVREGLADYIALGDMAAGDAVEMLDDPHPWFEYGSYPVRRAMVSMLLRRAGWDVDRLLKTDLSEPEVLAMLKAELAGLN